MNFYRRLSAQWAALLLIIALAVGAWPAVAATTSVTINNFSFSPPVVNIRVGDTVTWINQAGSHTATGTGADPICGSGTIAVSQSVTFNTVGSFPYVCLFHSGLNMTGLVVVAAANVPPTVSITSPTNGQVFTAPASFTITASAADSDGTIQAVIFNTNGVGVDVAMFPPFQKTLSNVPAGTYALTAVAIDSGNLNTTSAVVNITVLAPNNPPTVSITSPTNGAKIFAGTTFPMTFLASDSDGTVTKVDLYEGPNLLFSLASPFTTNASGQKGANSTVYAVATDNLGRTGTSAPVAVQFLATNITLVPALLSAAGPSFTVSNSVVGHAYFLETLTNFTSPFAARWFPLATNTAPSNDFIFTDSVLTVPVPRLYRVRQSL